MFGCFEPSVALSISFINLGKSSSFTIRKNGPRSSRMSTNGVACGVLSDSACSQNRMAAIDFLSLTSGWNLSPMLISAIPVLPQYWADLDALIPRIRSISLAAWRSPRLPFSLCFRLTITIPEMMSAAVGLPFHPHNLTVVFLSEPV